MLKCPSPCEYFKSVEVDLIKLHRKVKHQMRIYVAFQHRGQDNNWRTEVNHVSMVFKPYPNNCHQTSQNQTSGLQQAGFCIQGKGALGLEKVDHVSVITENFSY